MSDFDFKSIEKTWSNKWIETGLYSPNLQEAKRPFFNLMMFPYPSAEGLHVGNMYAFTGADVYGRFQRMQGFDVLEPIGLDGFGIHSENYAIKVGRHPKEHAQISQENFYRQLSSIGDGFAWDRRIETYNPEYYRFTQWLFIQMFNAGLAYKSKASVNWCPSDKTVLSDEQVIDGKCERCGSEVTRREMSSWFFKITKYADELLSDIETINWPEKIKTAQRQWIGKSEGLSIEFKLEHGESLHTWTKYWETVYGATFIVVAPEHKVFTTDIIPDEHKKSVSDYIKEALNKSEQERKMGEKDKTGVFTGLYATNPVNGAKIPVWVADYVLTGVGTGAVMGVPAHDSRDFAFAVKYNLPRVQVVAYDDPALNERVSKGEDASESEGTLVHSGEFDGLSSSGEGKEKMAAWLLQEGYATPQTTYHIRDWGISRQRYWGPPIPMIYCASCEKEGKGPQSEHPGWYTEAIENLPILLPDIEDFKPKGDGTSPLENASDEWKHVQCPGCGGEARRELDVSDTFLDSAWYFLAFTHMKDGKWMQSDTKTTPFDVEILKKWYPVNTYIGGAEHAVLHLLYARFTWKVLQDLKFLPQELGREPFPYLYGHGLIIKDGAKMSKSKGNVVVPDDYIEKFGADCLRTYLMFLGPYDMGGDFRDTGIEGMYRFIKRVWDLATSPKRALSEADEHALRVILHQTIQKATTDIPAFRYNTAISKIMELVNAMRDMKPKGEAPSAVWSEAIEALVQMMSPFAPFMAEELWVNTLGNAYSVHHSAWPAFVGEYAQATERTIVVQINGKIRGQFVVPMTEDISQEEAQAKALAIESVTKWLEGGYKKVIYIPGKIVNFVV